MWRRCPPSEHCISEHAFGGYISPVSSFVFVYGSAGVSTLKRRISASAEKLRTGVKLINRCAHVTCDNTRAMICEPEDLGPRKDPERCQEPTIQVCYFGDSKSVVILLSQTYSSFQCSWYMAHTGILDSYQ